jgi:hypothetical protein
MKDYKEELREALFQYLSEYPEDGPEFLDVISSAMKSFKRKVTVERSRQASEAVHFLFYFVNTKKKFTKSENMEKELIKLMDAMYIRYPKGNCKGGSSLDKEVFTYFISLTKSISKVDEFYEFLEISRGKDFKDWFKIILTEANNE